ncbi:MAG: hypothetical protein ABW162_14520 [Candidatus Sedimenticola sp. PURPLELP]
MKILDPGLRRGDEYWVAVVCGYRQSAVQINGKFLNKEKPRKPLIWQRGFHFLQQVK